MTWPAIPTEIFWTLGGVIALLSASSLYVWHFARRNPDKDYGELASRIRTWWWIVGLFCAALIVGPTTSILFFMLVSLLAFREFARLMLLDNDASNTLPWAYAAIPLQYYWVYIGWYGVFIIFIPVYMFLLLPLRTIIAGATSGFVRAASTLQWGLMTTTFSLSHAAYLLVLHPGAHPRVTPQWPSVEASQSPGLGFTVLLILLTELNDVAQYIWGKSLGRRRIVPKVSPNKTAAGFFGGVGTTIAVATILGPCLTLMGWQYSLLAGALIAVGGFVGDLSISMLKRDLGVKDSGATLPGHGGVLDRVDSLSYSAPLYFHYVYFFFI